MDKRRILRLAAAVILAELTLAAAGFFRSQAISLSIYLETGRVVRPSRTPDTEPSREPATEKTESPASTEEALDVPVFSAGDLDLLQMKYSCNYRPDLAALLEQPLAWDLTDGQPAVLIIHTHTTESYTGDYSASEDYRTLDESQNMLSIGDEVARILENGGIIVIHDRELHDYPDYNGAYTETRAAIKAYLKEYPTIRVVLDLHRDAAQTTEGQLVTSATVGGQRSAQLMMVVGTDASGNHHPNWQENLSLALKLSVALEQENPGICRPISLRSQRFNLDLTEGSLLVEVGAAGNTHEEAIIAANALAQALLTLVHGANT